MAGPWPLQEEVSGYRGLSFTLSWHLPSRTPPPPPVPSQLPGTTQANLPLPPWAREDSEKADRKLRPYTASCPVAGACTGAQKVPVCRGGRGPGTPDLHSRAGWAGHPRTFNATMWQDPDLRSLERADGGSGAACRPVGPGSRVSLGSSSATVTGPTRRKKGILCPKLGYQTP